MVMILEIMHLSFIQRRILHCVQKEKLTSISALQEKILRDPETMKKLFSHFSINVTEMFRDPTFFKSFRTNIIPYVRDYPNIRIWHVGCLRVRKFIQWLFFYMKRESMKKLKYMQPILTQKFRSGEERDFFLIQYAAIHKELY